MWEIERRNACVWTAVGHEGAVLTIAYSPCGTRLVSGGADKSVRMWDISAEVGRWVGQGHAGAITCLAYR